MIVFLQTYHVTFRSNVWHPAVSGLSLEDCPTRSDGSTRTSLLLKRLRESSSQMLFTKRSCPSWKWRRRFWRILHSWSRSLNKRPSWSPMVTCKVLFPQHLTFIITFCQHAVIITANKRQLKLYAWVLFLNYFRYLDCLKMFWIVYCGF